MSNELWWAIMRASGLTSWFFLTLTLVWGAIVSGRLVGRNGARRWLLDLHPYLGSIGLATLVLHIVGAVADTYVKIDAVDAFVPFTSGWNAWGVGLGVLAMWLLVTVEVTSLLRRRLARRTWHGIHLASYGMAWLVTLHAAFTGTDLKNPAVAWAAFGLVVAASVVGVRRALRGGERSNPATSVA